eukprot:1134484-Pyramimonas_sp.AAC.1
MPPWPLGLVLGGGESQAPLASSYRDWAGLAEAEVAELAGVELRAPGARGSVPDMVSQPVYFRDVKPPRQPELVSV